MDRIFWLFRKRYELSGDGVGLLRYYKQNRFYHVHSSEMTRVEKRTHRILTRLKRKKERKKERECQ